MIQATLVLPSLAAAGALAERLPLWEAGAGVAVISFPEYRGSNERRMASDFSHVKDVGWVFQPNLNVDARDVLGHKGWNLGLLGGPVFSDRRYNQYFYAVDPAFATADRPAYSTGGGYAGTQFVAALSKRYRDFWIDGFARWDKLKRQGRTRPGGLLSRNRSKPGQHANPSFSDA